MAINPEYWRKSRDEASIHVQIRLDRWPVDRAADSKVSGPIVRIFRDRTGKLKIGDKLTFEVSVYVSRPREEDSGPPMPGRQTVGLDSTWLEAAKFIEAYLETDAEKNTYHLVWDQATALLRKTEKPVNPPGGDSPYGVLVTDEVLEQARSPRRASWWSRWFTRG